MDNDKEFNEKYNNFPMQCPNCGRYFESDDMWTEEYKEGYKTVMHCPKCKKNQLVGYDKL